MDEHALQGGLRDLGLNMLDNPVVLGCARDTGTTLPTNQLAEMARA